MISGVDLMNLFDSLSEAVEHCFMLNSMVHEILTAHA